MSWQEQGLHPNSKAALALRHKELKKAAVPFAAGTRIGVIRRIARGKKVLDVGCVAHRYRPASQRTKRWLHDHVVEVSAECLGVDYDKVGVQRMRDDGYDVVQADITGDLTPILERGPFDVVVAGEIIEHLPNPQALLAMAHRVLRPGGRLVVSTPNPYALRRQRAGAVGITWENVDHIAYMFPSGMAEMARRTGLVLRRYGTVGWPAPQPLRKDVAESLRSLVKALWARARGTRNPFSRERYALPLPTFWLSPVDVVLLRLRGRRAMLRETAIYVLVKPARPAQPAGDES
jgi:2-polyprenyl-3-methyl-5-hydroxy-6-metoxy-1,4-benzoquinol methylase